MADKIVKVCPKHGETEHYTYKQGGYTKHRCKRCNVERVTARRKQLKLDAIAYKGGKCCRCGYDNCNAALEFHHTDPNEKDFGISQDGLTLSWSRVKAELDKCILLCANCHREEHERCQIS